MDDFERLAIAQALYKGLAEAVSTKSDGNLRAACDAQALADWEAMGFAPVARQHPLMAKGIKVGNLSCERKMVPMVIDEDAWQEYQRERGWFREKRPTVRLDWLTDAQFGRVLKLIESMDAASCIKQTEPDWLGLGHVKPLDDGTVVNATDGDEVPGVIGRWDCGTRVSGCKPADVAAALSAGGIDAGALVAELVSPRVTHELPGCDADGQ